MVFAALRVWGKGAQMHSDCFSMGEGKKQVSGY